MSLTKFQLKNGLKVLLIPNHKSPVVSVQMWVHNGSADEGKGEEGLSHFVEHLVFKGSRKFGPGEIAKSVEGSGGELNAYTSFDQTVFYVTISKSFVDVALESVLEMMGFPLFDPKEVNAERDVVIEEIKRGKDNPQRMASQLLFSTVYQKHPYGRPVIGYDKVVNKTSVKNIKKFYQARYSPKNMFLVVAGDFKATEIKKKIIQAYSEIPVTKVSKPKRTKEPVQKSPRLKIETSTFKQSLGYISWPVPAISHKDHVVLDVMTLILGQGDSSRLVHKLRLEKPLVNSVGAFSYGLSDGGVVAVSFAAEPEKLTEIYPEISKEILRIKTELVSDDEIAKAIINLSAQEIYSAETVNGLANKAGSQQFFYKDPLFHLKYLKQLAKVTSKDVLRVAKKYLVKEKVSLTLVTKNKSPQIARTTKQFIQGLKQDKALVNSVTKNKTGLKNKTSKLSANLSHAVAARGRANQTHRLVTESGIRLFIRPVKDTPLVSARVGFLGGARLAGMNQSGLAELTTRCWLGGTEVRDEIEIARESEALGIGLGATAGRNSIIISADYLAKFEKTGVDLFGDVLLNAHFPEEVFAREREIQINQIKNKADNPAQVCSNEFLRLMFPDHPYSQDVLGTAESLNKFQQEHLLKFKFDSLDPKKCFVVVTGNADPEKWHERLSLWEKAMPMKPAAIKDYNLSPLMRSQHGFLKIDKEQTHLIVGYRGLAIDSKDRLALNLIQSVLAGQGGRLFLELRDKESLAYAVSPMMMMGVGTGYFGGYIACSPEKTKKARDMMLQEFDKIASHLVSEQELLRSKRYLIGSHDIDLQRTTSIASAILLDEIYGLNSDTNFNVGELYMQITAEQVRDVAARIFNSPSVTVVAGKEDISVSQK